MVFKKKINGNTITLFSFIAGVITGLFSPKIVQKIAFMGDVYMNALKIMIVPLLMTQVIVSVCNATSKTLTKRILRAIVIFTVMFVISFCITAIFTAVLRPGIGAFFCFDDLKDNFASINLRNLLLIIVPDNILSAMTKNSVLPCIAFSFVFGVALSKSKGNTILTFLKEFEKTLIIVFEYVMWLAPFGVFALVGNAVSLLGTEIVQIGLEYIVIAWVGSILVLFVVMILPVWFYAHISPWQFIKKVNQVWVTTISTCSSVATLSQSIKVCNDNFEIPEEFTNIVVPLGCSINMCGGAVSFCLLGLFSMQIMNQTISVGFFMYMLFVAVLMNMAAPGIPGGGIALGATYLNIIGGSTAFIGMYSGIYRLLDMVYTTLNVSGDITANILLYAYEEKRLKKAKIT